VAAARLRDGSWVAATDQGLALGDLRIDWAAVTHAQWSDEDETLALAWLDGRGTGERRLLIDDPGAFPETVHARVTATIVLSRRLRVAGRLGVRVAARRQPGSDELVWQAVPDRGVDPDDPALRAGIDAAIREMTTELGA
jgi:hypothetical protein